MRLRALTLERFGHFAGAKLELPASGLTVVHGRNEAGKTTLLESIRWLFFGGAKDTRYAFAFDPQLLAVSARVDIRSSTLQVRRTRGRGGGLKGTVASGDEVDEAWILQSLGSPNRALFENVFGFSLEGLAAGAKALASDEVQTALFGGAVGGTIHPSHILEDLAKEKDQLFKEDGRNQKVPGALKRIDELTREITQASTRVEEWTRREAALHEAEARSGETSRALHDAQGKLDRLRAIDRALGAYSERETAMRELSTLHAPDALPVDAASTHERLLQERARIDAALAKEAERADEARLALAALVVDERVLARAAEIDVLGEQLATRVQAAAEHPRRVRELEAHTEDATRRLADLRPDWTLDRLREARIDAAARVELQQAVDAREELEMRTGANARELTKERDTLRTCDAELAALPEPVDPSPLRAFLEGWSGFVAERSALAQLEANLSAARRRHASLRQRLSPPLAADADPAGVVAPDDIDAFARARVELERARAKLEGGIGEREEELAVLTRALAQVDASAHVPTEGDLAGLRSKRDAAFDAVLRAAIDARAELPSLAVAHERARIAADEAADRMRRHADAVQRRAQQDASRARLEEELAARRAELARIDESAEAAEAKWRSAWTGLVPLSPESMRGWLASRQEWAREGETVAELEARRAELEQRVRTFRERAEAEDVDRAHAEAKSRLEAEERRAREEHALTQRRSRAEREIARLDAERLQLDAERETMLTRWAEAVAPFGLAAETSPAAARAIVEGLERLRADLLAREAKLHERLAELDEQMRQFDERVAHVAEGEPVATTRSLMADLKTAREAARARAEAERSLAEAERRIAQAHERRDEVVAELRALHALAGSDEADFARVAQARQRIVQLRRDVESREREIDLARGPLDRDAFLSELAQSTPEGVRIALDEAKRAFDAATAQFKDAEREVGSARELLRAIDGRSAAADARAVLEQERAALRAHVERWSVLALAERLLRDAIAKFERENQPQLLERTSSLFAEMTLGRYAHVRRHADGNLWVERNDGVEVTSDRLSTGTREQLFLAIRLAYVDLYRKAAEALPVVLDDVLVNFDATRAAATLRALARFGSDVQVLFFTCHDHMVELARAASAHVLAVPAAQLAAPA